MYTAGNIYACMMIYKELGYTDKYKIHKRNLDKIITLIKNNFWNEKDGIFYDIDVATVQQCHRAMCYDSFVPLMWNLINLKKYDNSLLHLFDYSKLSYEFCNTTVEKECPMYWSDNALIGPENSS